MSQVQTRASEVQPKTDRGRPPVVEPNGQQEQAPQTAYRRAQAHRNGLTPADLLALQRTVGNRQVQRMLERRGAALFAGNAIRRAGDGTAVAAVESSGTEVAILTAPAPTQEDPNKPAFDAYKGQSINKLGHVSAPANQYEVAKTSGVKVRAKPDGALPHIAKVVYDTEVQAQALDNTGAFYFIIATTGAVGWINKDFIALDPPDTGARLHHITESNLTTILKTEYIDKKLWALGTGNDYTTLAAAVVVANAGRKGVFVDWEAAQKYKDDNTLKRLFDPWMIDNFAIYHGSTILAGHNIWLPSANYVRMLQNSGQIGSRPGWVNAAVDVGKGIAGFIAGVVSGIFGSIWDTLTGLWELGKGIVSTIRSVLDGSLFASIEAIYDTVTNMTWEDLKHLVDEIITMGQNAFNDFKKKWEHPDTYQQWHFKGYIIGAVALEVVLAIFTGGASLGAKVLAKIGKYFPKLMRVLSKLLDVADDLARRRGKRGADRDRDRDKDDKEMSNADRAWEQARSIAAIVTGGHDEINTPVAKLIPILNETIAAVYKGVRGYKALPIGPPGTYKIIQLTRRKDVDDHYTEGETKEGAKEGEAAKGAETTPAKTVAEHKTPLGTPGGKRTTISPKDKDPANIRALTKENESADKLAKAGFEVEQNPKVPGAKNPDYIIDGRVFDNFAPTSSNARHIVDTLDGKVGTKQADRIVLNLDDSAVTLDALKKELTDSPIEKLQEIIVIRGDQIIRFFPF